LLNSIKERNVDLKLGETFPDLVNIGLGILSLKSIRKRGNGFKSHREKLGVALKGVESLVIGDSSSLCSFTFLEKGRLDREVDIS